MFKSLGVAKAMQMRWSIIFPYYARIMPQSRKTHKIIILTYDHKWNKDDKINQLQSSSISNCCSLKHLITLHMYKWNDWYELICQRLIIQTDKAGYRVGVKKWSVDLQTQSGYLLITHLTHRKWFIFRTTQVQ